MTISTTTMKHNKDERIVLRLTKDELKGIDERVLAAKERGEKSNRSMVAREAFKELLTAA